MQSSFTAFIVWQCTDLMPFRNLCKTTWIENFQGTEDEFKVYWENLSGEEKQVWHSYSTLWDTLLMDTCLISEQYFAAKAKEMAPVSHSFISSLYMLIQLSPRLRRRKSKARLSKGEQGERRNWEREPGRAGASGSEQG
jgi:hypothetical protein